MRVDGVQKLYTELQKKTQYKLTCLCTVALGSGL